MNDNGLCYDDYKFDRRGGWEDNYALSSTKFNDLEWTRSSKCHPPTFVLCLAAP